MKQGQHRGGTPLANGKTIIKTLPGGEIKSPVVDERIFYSSTTALLG